MDNRLLHSVLIVIKVEDELISPLQTEWQKQILLYCNVGIYFNAWVSTEQNVAS